MKNIHYVVLYLFCMMIRTHTVFDWLKKSRAAYQAQNEEWGKSKEVLQKLLVDNPYDVSLLYDLGVSAYKLQEYQNAKAYFDAVISSGTENKNVLEKAYFNYGNTCVQLKQLKDAIAAYEAALEIDPNDEHAKHNLEIVKKMLDQENEQNQEQQSEQNNQNQDQKDQQSSSQNNDDKQDQSKDNQGQSQNQKNDSEQNSDISDESQQGDNQQGAGNDKNDKKRDFEQNEEQEDKSESGNRDQQQQKDSKSDNPRTENADNSPQSQEENDVSQSKGDLHDESPEDQSENASNIGSNDTQEIDKEQVVGFEQDDTFKELDERLQHMLKAREDKDARLSKQIIKMQVDSQLAGKSGQNRW